MSIASNVQTLLKKPATVVVAVTKNRTLEEIEMAIQAGITHIGENRWQEATEKLPRLPQGVTKHFIGHLQSNKVKQVVGLFDMIQSVDSLRLAQKINQECEKLNKVMPILIEVNTSGEPQKSGTAPEGAMELTREAVKLPHLKIQGLMTIAIHSADPEKVRACFRILKKLFDEIARQKIPNVEMKWLSMGMSEDYEIALEEGATMVRLGRAIFRG